MPTCPQCTDAEARYEELLEVHGKTITRVTELEKKVRDALAIGQDLTIPTVNALGAVVRILKH